MFQMSLILIYDSLETLEAKLCFSIFVYPWHIQKRSQRLSHET